MPVVRSMLDRRHAPSSSVRPSRNLWINTRTRSILTLPCILTGRFVPQLQEYFFHSFTLNILSFVTGLLTPSSYNGKAPPDQNDIAMHCKFGNLATSNLF